MLTIIARITRGLGKIARIVITIILGVLGYYVYMVGIEAGTSILLEFAPLTIIGIAILGIYLLWRKLKRRSNQRNAQSQVSTEEEEETQTQASQQSPETGCGQIQSCPFCCSILIKESTDQVRPEWTCSACGRTFVVLVDQSSVEEEFDREETKGQQPNGELGGCPLCASYEISKVGGTLTTRNWDSTSWRCTNCRSDFRIQLRTSQEDDQHQSPPGPDVANSTKPKKETTHQAPRKSPRPGNQGFTKKLAIGGAVTSGVLVVLFMLLMLFSPPFFNDLVLRPIGIGVDTAAYSCDDHLKTVINPRTGSFGATSAQVNDAVLEVQTRYHEECHYTDWNPVALDGQAFGTTANHCFSAKTDFRAIPRRAAAATTPLSGEKLYVGRVTVPTAFFNTDSIGLTDTPRAKTRRDSAGNVIVFFHPKALPVDGSHCWLFRAGQLNQWFSNRDQ